MRIRKRLVFLASAGLLLAVAAFWVLITPDNPLTGLFRSKISNTDARVIVGPYPLEEDFRILKKHHVTLIVSLLDPRLPYEAVLLERERELARKHRMRLLHFPMTSILGRGMGRDYEQNAALAAEAVAREPGKVYLHCYLGLHRIKVVEELLLARSVTTGAYLVRQAERTEHARLLEQAQTQYEAGRYRVVLDILKQLKHLDQPGRLLQAWATYRMGDIAAARELFSEILQTTPGSSDARVGLGYCALRENNLNAAEQHFAAVLEINPSDDSALVGMGLVRYRQNRLDQAASYFEASLKINPDNHEARDTLARIVPQSSKEKP